jgi:hypothetical protein
LQTRRGPEPCTGRVPNVYRVRLLLVNFASLDLPRVMLMTCGRGKAAGLLAGSPCSRPNTTCLHPVPPAFAGTPRFLAPRRNRPRLRFRHEKGTRWGVNGDSDPSGSARQQQTSRRSTGSPRTGSQGEGSLATRQSARADERRPAAAPARPPQVRAELANRRPRTRAPHGEARSEKTEGRASARTASDRDRSTR